MKRKIKVERMDYGEDSFLTQKVYLDVGSVFLTGSSIIFLSQLWLWCEKNMLGMRSGVFDLLRKGLIFFVKEPKKIAKLSRNLFNHYFSSYLPIVSTRIFLNVFCPLKMVKWRCLYRKMECEGWSGQSLDTLVDHC